MGRHGVEGGVPCECYNADSQLWHGGRHEFLSTIAGAMDGRGQGNFHQAHGGELDALEAGTNTGRWHIGQLMKKHLQKIDDDLKEIHDILLDRVNYMRRELRAAEEDLVETEKKREAIADAILRLGVFLPMRDEDKL